MSDEKDNEFKLPENYTIDTSAVLTHTTSVSDSITITDGYYTSATNAPYFNSNIDRFLFENFNMETVNKVDTCTSCNKPDSNIKLTYKVFSIDRNICHKCCGSLVDKLFGANVNIDTEELLYKEDNEKNS